MRSVTEADVRRVFDGLADRYDRQMSSCERLLFPGARQWATARATGRVVEIAIGTGLNLPFYADDVTVIGVELSERMLAHARRRAEQAGLTGRVELRQGDVQHLALADGTADTVVSTFTLCTIPDPAAAAREAYRVLRPGGRFVLVEHGPSSNPVVRGLMRLVEPLAVRSIADHLTRDPLPILERAGFRLDTVNRTRLGVGFHVVATRPVTT